jgi:hypothetical protein
MEEYVAEAICRAAGHAWPCPHDRYSIAWSHEAVSKWWVEIAEHAIAAVETYEATHGPR